MSCHVQVPCILQAAEPSKQPWCPRCPMWDSIPRRALKRASAMLQIRPYLGANAVCPNKQVVVTLLWAAAAAVLKLQSNAPGLQIESLHSKRSGVSACCCVVRSILHSRWSGVSECCCGVYPAVHPMHSASCVWVCCQSTVLKPHARGQCFGSTPTHRRQHALASLHPAIIGMLSRSVVASSGCKGKAPGSWCRTGSGRV
jgi:hypothetical protein